MRQIIDVVERYTKAIESRDADAFQSLFAAEAVGHHPLYEEPIRGRDAIREAEQALFESFSDIAIEVRSVVSEDNRCAIEVALTAVNTGPLDLGGEPLPATGRTVELPATWWLDVDDDGLIVEARDYLDTATFMRQLGFEAP